MDKYLIRFAMNSEIPSIMKFIGEHWKKNHILSYDRSFFEWQYMSDKLDYVIGMDDEKKIHGMLAFISYDSTDKRDIATSMWKAQEGSGFLGIKMLLYLLDECPHRVLFSPGINIKTSEQIYRRMGILTGTMKQWYRLRDISDYKIATISVKTIPRRSSQINGNFIRYQTFSDLLSTFNYDKYVTKDMIPYKSRIYFEKRYFQHPSYQYLVYGVERDGEVRAVIVLRIQKCNGSQAIRFVDCLGNYAEIAYATAGLDLLLDEFDAEYVDMYESGLSDEMLRGAGWLPVKESGNIIHNYFSPFEQRVVDIHYCTSNPDIVLFRGDGDQDRPN